MFKVGDRVKYVSGNHGEGETNPLFSKYKVLGTVDGIEESGGWIGVQWDNGEHNSYYEEDLKLATRKDASVKKRPVRFLLKYELDEDPVEEFEAMKEVNDRIEELVMRSDLKRDSMVVYEVKSKKLVTIKTTIKIK